MNALDVQFSERERQIMRCICRGMAYKEIAPLCGVQYISIKKIVERMVRDMGARNLQEAVFIWGTAELPDDATVEQLAKRLARIAMETAMRRLENGQAGGSE